MSTNDKAPAELPRWYHGPVQNTARPEAPKVEVVLTREESVAWRVWVREERERQEEERKEQ